MWMTADDARSDFILAGATTLLGGLVVVLLSALPFYPDQGLLGLAVFLGWVFVLTGLVPWLLVRYRSQGAAGFGFDDGRGAIAQGVLLALPIVAVGYLRGLGTQGVVGALLGRLNFVPLGDPTIAEASATADALLEVLANAALFVVVAISALMLYPFLVVRARDGFARRDMPLVEGLRTFGMGAAGAGLLLGLLTAITPSIGFQAVLLNVAGLVAIILLTDRLIPPGQTTSRATLLAPAIVAVLIQVLAFGGLFRGDLLQGLYTGALSAGTVIVVAALIETRRYAWAVVPVVVAAALYPTCLTLPVALRVTSGC